MTPIDMAAAVAGDVAFGKAGDADAKAAGFANEADELIGVFESAFGLFEFAIASGGIAAQGQNIFDSQSPDLSDDVADFFAGGIDTGQMGHGRELVLALNAIDDHQGLFPGAAARAVGDGAIIGLKREQGGDGLLQEILVALIGFRRKEFKRDDGTFGISFG